MLSASDTPITDGIEQDIAEGQQLIRLSALCDEPWMPRARTGKRLNRCVPFRWASRGSHGVRLETLKAPSGLHSTRGSVMRFFAALAYTGGSDGLLNTRCPAPTPARRRRQIESANRELQLAGIL